MGLIEVKCLQETLRVRPEHPAVIPYTHGISHNLKKVRVRYGVPVVFASPNKLIGLISSINANNEKRGHMSRCGEVCITPFVPCKKAVVYQISFLCGRMYMGHTGRCLNDRLHECHAALGSSSPGHLANHCSRCDCSPEFGWTEILSSYSGRVAREIGKARHIRKEASGCTTAPCLFCLMMT